MTSHVWKASRLDADGHVLYVLCVNDGGKSLPYKISTTIVGSNGQSKKISLLTQNVLKTLMGCTDHPQGP